MKKNDFSFEKIQSNGEKYVAEEINHIKYI